MLAGNGRIRLVLAGAAPHRVHGKARDQRDADLCEQQQADRTKLIRMAEQNRHRFIRCGQKNRNQRTGGNQTAVEQLCACGGKAALRQAAEPRAEQGAEPASALYCVQESVCRAMLQILHQKERGQQKRHQLCTVDQRVQKDIYEPIHFVSSNISAPAVCRREQMAGRQKSIFCSMCAPISAMGTRTCSMVSRSRMVTQPSVSVSKSTVMQSGVPISSSRR